MCKSLAEVESQLLVVVINCRVDGTTGQCEKEQNKNLKLRVSFRVLLTLFMNMFKSLLTIAFTTRPFTSANQIDIIVRTTKRAANNPMYENSLVFHEGITYLVRRVMRFQNSASTFPLPDLLFYFSLWRASSSSFIGAGWFTYFIP